MINELFFVEGLLIFFRRTFGENPRVFRFLFKRHCGDLYGHYIFRRCFIVKTGLLSVFSDGLKAFDMP